MVVIFLWYPWKLALHSTWPCILLVYYYRHSLPWGESDLSRDCVEVTTFAGGAQLPALSFVTVILQRPVCVCVCVVCAYVYECAYMSVRICACVYECVYVYVQVCMCVCVCVCVCVWGVHMYMSVRI